MQEVNEIAKNIAAEQLIIKGLEVLAVNEGDIIVIKTPESKLSDDSSNGIVAAIQHFCAKRKLEAVSVIVIPQDIDIRNLHPAAMRQLGWERRPNLVVTSGLPPNGKKAS